MDGFRGSPRPTLGVELELQIVDARTLALTAAGERLLAEVPPDLRDAVKPEFYHCCVEINTGVCDDVQAVEDDMSRKLAAVRRVADRLGVLLGWGGTHPFSHWRDQPIVATPRYRELAEHYRETLCRQLTFGLHVHVGVADGDAAVRACNRIPEYLPALLALSANSPFWCGRATGLHSHRTEVMSASPHGGRPPQLGGWDDYARLIEHLTAAGVIGTPKDLWWDVRPSPGHGTVEVRVCDMPPDLPSVLGLTALIQCLVHTLAYDGDGRPDLDEAGSLIVRQNRWRAARYGMGAIFIDPRSRRKATARETIVGLTERLGGIASELRCATALARAREQAAAGNGAERQLAVFQRTGDLLEVVRQQVGSPDAEVSAPFESAFPLLDPLITPVNGRWPAAPGVASPATAVVVK
jgi:carboxylate-amine ligase